MSLAEFNRVIDGFDANQELLGRYVAPEEIGATSKLVEHRRDDARPTIMVYGVYNAGKSTLINALMGVESASVADRPETDQIKAYDWQGFEILDTPGIDAPIEHEQVTKEQLDSADVIIFTLSSHGIIEEAKTFEVITGLVQRKRRVIIVINCRTSVSASTPEMLETKDKIRVNLQDFAKKLGIDNILDLVPIELVHAKSALKAKLENKQNLLEHSGIESVERRLLEFLRDSEVRDVVAVLASEVMALVDKAIGATERLAQSGGCQQIDKVQARLEREKQLIEGELLAYAQRASHSMQSEVRSLFECSASQAELEHGGLQISSAYGERVQSTMEDSLNKLSAKLPQICDELKLGEIHVGRIQVDGVPQNVTSDITDASIRVDLSQVQSALRSAVSQIAKEDIVKVLKFGKDTFPTLFKGVGSVGMEKIAGNAMKIKGGVAGGKTGLPWIDIGLQVAISAFQYYQARKEAQRQIEEQQRIARAIDDGVRQFADSFFDHAKQVVAECIEKAFTPVFEELRAIRSGLSGEIQHISEDAERLRAFRRVLELEAVVPGILTFTNAADVK